MIRINGVMTTNFRRLQPLLVGVMERQAQSITARAQAALPPQGSSPAGRCTKGLSGARATGLPG